MMDYSDKIIEGVRRLRRLSKIADTKAALRREALTAKKRDVVTKPLWQYPETFDMEHPGGYWVRSAIPRIQEAASKGLFYHAMSKIIGPFE